MRIIFLDQSGKLGGAELSLLDLAQFYKSDCLVGLFQDGPFRDRLTQAEIPVKVLSQGSLRLSKSSSFLQNILGSATLLPLLHRTLQLSRGYDLIYSNTQKAFVIGALVSALTGKPLIHHQRDILSEEHFSRANLRLLIFLANRFATRVIANSMATQAAFIQAGGDSKRCSVIYNGFDPEQYHSSMEQAQALRQSLGITQDKFVIGHFSRLSPWKGQHVLIDAIAQSPNHVIALLVGDALFGEDEYVYRLKTQVQELGLGDRIHFLGFRSDIPKLMAACDLVAHTSTAPEPFGRVIVESMLSGTPVVAAQAGGAVELIEPGETGWLTPPGNVPALTTLIQQLSNKSSTSTLRLNHIAQEAQKAAQSSFTLTQTHQRVNQLLEALALPQQPVSVSHLKF